MFEEITVCPATQAMLQKAKDENIKTCFDRVKDQRAVPLVIQGDAVGFAVPDPVEYRRKRLIQKRVCVVPQQMLLLPKTLCG